MGIEYVDNVNLYVDMDGVICNFIQSAIEAHEGVTEVGSIVPSQVDTWNLFEQYDVNRTEFFEPIIAWDGFWKYIAAYEYAEEFMSLVNAAAEESKLNVTVHFCSTPIEDPDCYAGKLQWLQDHGFMASAESLILVKDKSALIRPEAILIDDRQETVDLWRVRGGMAVLYPRQWNKGGVTLVEGDSESEKEGMLRAIEDLKFMLAFREWELELSNIPESTHVQIILPPTEELTHMSDDTEDFEDFLDELEGAFPTPIDEVPVEDLTIDPEDTPEPIVEALAEVTPEDGEVRAVSSTGGEKGTKLARFDLIPIEPLTELAKHFGRGSQKYDDHNYRKGYEWSKSYAACMRHLTQFWAGEDVDEETGTPHVIAAAWHCMALHEFMLHHPDFDDRYDYDE